MTAVGGDGRKKNAVWVPVMAFGLAAVAGVAASARIARGGPLLSARWGLLAGLAVWAVAWVVAVVAGFGLPRRAAVPLILLVAAALRVAAISGPPTTTDDFYRYAWDGRVQAAGLNPYEYTPSAPELAHLREPWLWPEERPCPVAFRPDHCTRINRPGVPTIYPPGAQAWFSAVYRLTGVEARWKAWQVAGLVTDLGIVALLAVGLRRRGKDLRWVALYGLCPAPVLEVVNNGHVDGLAIGVSVAALLVAPVPPAPQGATGRGGAASTAEPAVAAQPVAVAEWRWLAAGALVGAATLVKLVPALLVPALIAAAPSRRGRVSLRVGGAATAVVVAGYLPHVFVVGTKVVGYLPGYLREEQYDGAGRYLVAGALRLPGGMAAVVSALVMAAAAAWVWRRRPPAPVGAAVLTGTLLLAASPAQPWYAVALLAFAALAAAPIWAVVVAAGYPYFVAVILVHPQRVGIGQLAYGTAAMVVAAALLLRGRPAPGRSMRRCPPNGC